MSDCPDRPMPRIVAIVNITEDSFSDGGRYLAPEAAIDHARALASAGAALIELGPASSNPDARAVSAREQIRRLKPVVECLAKGPLPLSIDATTPEVIEWAVDSGVSTINDIRGFPDESTQRRLADSNADLVVVHSLLGRDRATRDEATPEEVLASIDRFFETRFGELVRAGVSEERLILDPGMGFFLGRDPRASLAVLERIPELRERFGRPVFISVSRKSFLRAISGRPIDEIGSATLAAELYAARRGADFLRTHDVAALASALAIEKALNESH